ncbi:MAG: 30S ribosomal protein S20 [Eubacteriales bacterium]|nr:30S ribosomal protein S20 [Eubacteriales bacterium]
MANIKSAKKRVKTTAKKTAANRVVKDGIKEALKTFDAQIAAGQLEEAAATRTDAEKKLKKAAAKHTISSQAASRKVSQITKKLNAANAAK